MDPTSILDEHKGTVLFGQVEGCQCGGIGIMHPRLF